MIIQNIYFDGLLFLILIIRFFFILFDDGNFKIPIGFVLLLWCLLCVPSKRLLVVEYSDSQQTYLFETIRVYGSPTLELTDGETISLKDYELKCCKKYILNVTDTPLFLQSFRYNSDGYLSEVSVMRTTIQKDSIVLARRLPDYIFKEPPLVLKKSHNFFYNYIGKRCNYSGLYAYDVTSL